MRKWHRSARARRARGISGFVPRAARIGLAVMIPPGFEAGQPRPPLLPTDGSGMWEFLEPTRAGAVPDVPPHVIEPAEQNGSDPVHLQTRAGPDRRQRFSFAKAALESLSEGIIVRVHHQRFRAIDNPVALRNAPARILVVLGILHGFKETATNPNV